jgi:hypothetical protein
MYSTKLTLKNLTMKTSTHPTMRPYEGDEMQDSEESKESKVEANVIRPSRYDYGDREKGRSKRADDGRL